MATRFDRANDCSSRRRLCSLRAVAAALPLLAAAGCGKATDESPIVEVEQTVAPELPGPPPGSVAALRDALGLRSDEGQFQKAGGKIVIADLTATSVRTIEPLRELPLQKLALTDTRVENLSPLSGKSLELLYATGCPVSDLSGLAGCRIDQLNLMECPIKSLEGLQTATLGTLWLRECPLSDLSPLATTGLVSLDVQDTQVASLEPLAEMSTLRRLNIAGTNVSDLSPLASLALERLIFTPERVTDGIEAIRTMPTLEAIDTSFEGERPIAMPAAEFWKRFDAGEFGLSDSAAAESDLADSP